MPRLSKLLEKLEDRIANKWGRWYERNKARVPLYAVLGALGWYFYGMLLNSLKLGRESVFNTTGEEVESIWVLNPFRNLFVVLTPFGLGVTAVILLLICLITKKGYSWFSGYHFTRDPRGFDILPDGTHGTSGFATKKELAEHLELGSAREVTGMLLGRIKERPDDPEKYSTYVAHRMKPGENNNILCIGAPGSYKSRGFIIPFLMGCAQRSSSDGGRHPESVIATDPKGELFEMTAPYFEKNGFYVKAVNFLDMAHSDGWNCLAGLDTNPDLVTTVANTIIQNTSGPKEADDFWSRAELNLLMALIHYVCNKKDDRGNLLPLEQRSLGDVYKILAYKSVNEINRTLAELPPEHPAKGSHGLFLKARENLWGNIIIGLGNRLAVFQNPLVDKITRNHDVDLLLPGQRPCAYKDAAIASFCATNVTERFDHLSENADEDAAPQLSPPQWLSAIELLRYPDREVFRVDRRMVFQTIYQKLTQQVEEVQSDRIQIHNERYRLTKKDVRSNMERCLDMVKVQIPDKEPLIQEMIRSIR